MRQVERAVAVFLERLRNLARLFPIGDLQADKDMRLCFAADTVIELGYAAGADQLAKTAEAAAFLGNRNCEYRFARFADGLRFFERA